MDFTKPPNLNSLVFKLLVIWAFFLYDQTQKYPTYLKWAGLGPNFYKLGWLDRAKQVDLSSASWS